MRQPRVGLMLTVTLFVMAAAPLAAAFFLLHDALRTSLNLGFNPQVVEVLQDASDNLRTLGRLDEANRAGYRAQFDQVAELKHVYSEPELVKQRILDSLRLYFGLGFGAVLLLSLGVATLLGRRIARIHADNITELSHEREKVRYLQEMSSWQELAKMLAHEIKNPLTPIEVLVSSLSKAYLAKGQPEFLAHLAETQAMIGEELEHLKATVNKFSEFARMPQVQPVTVDLADVIERQLKGLAVLTDQAEVHWQSPPPPAMRASVDVTLFRQVLANILRNGIEANPGRRVRFDLSLDATPDELSLRIANDGAPVPAELAARIFDPYISTKPAKENMGLGLAIVKKIILEHGGEIHHEEIAAHPVFVIRLPRVPS